MNGKHVLAAVAVGVALWSATAMADIIITQGPSAPTYSTTLTFDEVGGPTGAVVGTEWQVSHGVTNLVSGTGAQSVGDNSVIEPWLPSDNTFNAPFGAFMTFAQDLTELSFQGWDNGGPPSPFGGGALVSIWNDGAEVASLFVTPAFGGFGDEWYDITTTGGMVFDEVRFLGFDFIPQSYINDVSWNVVPEPGSAILLTVVGAMMLRRRR